LAIIPNIIKSATKCDPPSVKNGKAIPTTGKNPILTPILIIISVANLIIKPIINSFAKLLLACWVYSYNCLNSKNKLINKIEIPIKPVSSAKAAKIKSVLASGKNLSCV